MTISEAMNQKLNEQVTHEMAASHSYLGMACALEKMGLKVFARRFYQQSDEERRHALKIVRFLHEVDGRVRLDSVPRPPSDFAGLRAILEAALESERTVTRQIDDLVSLAQRENDHATHSFLKWFVDEQVEEVAAMRDLLQLLTVAGEHNAFQVEGRLERMMGST